MNIINKILRDIVVYLWCIINNSEKILNKGEIIDLVLIF